MKVEGAVSRLLFTFVRAIGKNRPNSRIVAAGFFVIACIACCTDANSEQKDPLGSVAPYFLPIPSVGPFILPVPSPSTDATPNIFVVNKQRYVIPRNFIFSLSKHDDGTAAAISMRALLPNVEGLTPATMHCLNSRDACSSDVVTIGLVKGGQPLPGSKFLENIQWHVLPEKFSGPCGLEFYEEKGFESSRHRYFFKRMSADTDVSVLKCAKEGSSFTPTCHSNSNIEDGNYIYYIFDRKFLCEWEVIRRKIVDRIASFRAETSK